MTPSWMEGGSQWCRVQAQLAFFPYYHLLLLKPLLTSRVHQFSLNMNMFVIRALHQDVSQHLGKKCNVLQIRLK